MQSCKGQKGVMCDLRTDHRYSLPLQAKASLYARSINWRADFSGAHKVNLGTGHITTFNAPYRLERLPFTVTYSCG